jgi:glycine reductase
MCKEIDAVGIPIVHVCTVVPISYAVGVNRIVPGFAINHPVGNPKLPYGEERAERKAKVQEALKALCTEIDKQTVFE